MKASFLVPFFLAVASLAAAPSMAASVKVRLALDISGPFAGPGADARDGFARSQAPTSLAHDPTPLR